MGKWADLISRRPPSELGWQNRNHPGEATSQDSRKGQIIWQSYLPQNGSEQKDDPKVAHTKPEALDDITILDLSYNSFAGSYCTSLLSEFGAEVVKIEPSEGDFLRTCTPYGVIA